MAGQICVVCGAPAVSSVGMVYGALLDLCQLHLTAYEQATSMTVQELLEKIAADGPKKHSEGLAVYDVARK